MDKIYRTKICSELTVAIAHAIKAGQFPDDQLSPACQEILILIDTENQSDFMQLLTKFTTTWPQTISVLDNVQKQQGAVNAVEQMFARNTKPVNT